MDQLLQEFGKLSAPALAVLGAIVGAIGAVTAALLGRLVATPFLGARDKQDKEVEWRKHALELTKLDLERKLRTRSSTDTRSLRPSILDFLANYRDLQELGTKSPKDLYQQINDTRITRSNSAKAPNSEEETG